MISTYMASLYIRDQTGRNRSTQDDMAKVKKSNRSTRLNEKRKKGMFWFDWPSHLSILLVLISKKQ